MLFRHPTSDRRPFRQGDDRLVQPGNARNNGE
jgi:hypothetical protein